AAIADAFDAITTKRVYKQTLPVEQAVDAMRVDGHGISIRNCWSSSSTPWTRCATSGGNIRMRSARQPPSPYGDGQSPSPARSPLEVCRLYWPDEALVCVEIRRAGVRLLSRLGCGL